MHVFDEREFSAICQIVMVQHVHYSTTRVAVVLMKASILLRVQHLSLYIIQSRCICVEDCRTVFLLRLIPCRVSFEQHNQLSLVQSENESGHWVTKIR